MQPNDLDPRLKQKLEKEIQAVKSKLKIKKITKEDQKTEELKPYK